MPRSVNTRIDRRKNSAIGRTFDAMFGKLSNIFGKKEVIHEHISFSDLKVDVHSHFIPGIDDGAETIEDSLAMIAGMKELGYSKVITTPHVMSDFYRNSSEDIQRGCDRVREALLKENIDIEIECAAEYYLDAELMQKVKAKDLLTFGANYVLFELPFIGEPANFTSVVFEMQLAGYQPVLAHPERYGFWHNDISKYQDIADKGVLLQLNMNSLTGHYSPAVKKVAEEMVQNDLISLIGSDCHNIRHIDLMKRAACTASMHALLNKGQLKNATL